MTKARTSVNLEAQLCVGGAMIKYLYEWKIDNIATEMIGKVRFVGLLGWGKHLGIVLHFCVKSCNKIQNNATCTCSDLLTKARTSVNLEAQLCVDGATIKEDV